MFIRAEEAGTARQRTHQHKDAMDPNTFSGAEEDSALTYFAPAKRVGGEEIKRQADLFENSLAAHALDAVNTLVLILNSHRQAVFANRQLRELLGHESMEPVLGLRPGELLKCEHAYKLPGGCGTTKYCRQCGAARAIMKGLEGVPAEEECRITSRSGSDIEAWDFRVRGTPLALREEKFVVFSMFDISHEKRRRVLEHIFLHDILNTAGGLGNLVDLLEEQAPDPLKPDAQLINAFFKSMVEEIQAHKLLLAAESEELTVNLTPVNSKDMLASVRDMYSTHDSARGRTLRLDPDSPDFCFLCDATLLRRVLSNMVKNALEACPPGLAVDMRCSLEAPPNQGTCQAPAQNIAFRVHNPGAIAPENQLLIFQRSFSTKGAGRGLGAYSIKLLTERYLQGKASFVSAPETGTTFTVTFPLAPASAGACG